MKPPCDTCFGSGCRRCVHAPPGVSAARWVTLLAAAKQMDDRVNHGAAAPRKDAKETAAEDSLSTACRADNGGTPHRKAT